MAGLIGNPMRDEAQALKCFSDAGQEAAAESPAIHGRASMMDQKRFGFLEPPPPREIRPPDPGPDDPNVVTFTRAQLNHIRRIGRARQAHKAAHSYGRTTFRKGLDLTENHIRAYAAEVAFAILSGLPTDTRIGHRHGGPDFILPCKRTLDVTRTTRDDGYMQVAASKLRNRQQATHYCLFTGTLPTYRFAGWCPMHIVFRKSNLGQWDGAAMPFYRVLQSELNPIFDHLVQGAKYD